MRSSPTWKKLSYPKWEDEIFLEWEYTKPAAARYMVWLVFAAVFSLLLIAFALIDVQHTARSMTTRQIGGVFAAVLAIIFGISQFLTRPIHYKLGTDGISKSRTPFFGFLLPKVKDADERTTKTDPSQEKRSDFISWTDLSACRQAEGGLEVLHSSGEWVEIPVSDAATCQEASAIFSKKLDS